MVDGRTRFLAACRGENSGRPPFWMMRQAGRSLPEYRELKKKHTFTEIVQTPELAAEVTLQPVRRFGLDAAVIFSDILVVPEALGIRYSFSEPGGLTLENVPRTSKDLDSLDPSGIADRLSYLTASLSLVRKEIPDKALIGFAGSPWTLASFILSGGPVKKTNPAKVAYYENPEFLERFIELLTEAIIDVLRLQIEAGADVIQIFDSMAFELAPHEYREISAQSLKKILHTMKGLAPTLLYLRGGELLAEEAVIAGARAISLDHTVDLPNFRSHHPDLTLQGNLDPALLLTSPEAIRTHATSLLDSMKNDPAYIFNLGHGVPPDARLETLTTLTETALR